jgi:predicted kinase
MPRLIHLNGPSGVGKSTVARMYADRHPGVLDLDTDQIVSLIGGWQDAFWKALHAGRALAISMAETHLRTGHDVVMPQLATQWSEVEGFEAAAARAGAEYREIVLTIGKQQMVERCTSRPPNIIDEIITRGGGPVLLAKIHDDLTAYLATRPNCVQVATDERDAAETYVAVVATLTANSLR